ncbi:14597_t:CDS:1 [Racocetra fulgida]|uniref:14597_t:CDS:1 n=1 Tax=Racocetra fulgida TaxID=60492 RepID=A0A9N8ZTI4_9GLOM|nr:14597_t:CDS:1 [Racocetra fulgida]
MSNKNAQEYINEKYPINGTCNRKSDPENKGKRREEITKLDISKGKTGGENLFNREPKNLIGDLKLEGFTNLRIFKISSHQLISLDVSACRNLEELDCCENELTKLNINGCTKLKRINCTNNSGLTEINIKNCPSLDRKQSNTDLIYNNRTGKLVKRLPKQKSTPNFRQGRNANGNQVRNAIGKQERNAIGNQEGNTNKEIVKEIYTKRNKLRKLQIELSLKLKDNLANVLTKYLFKSHRMIVEGNDLKGYHSKNLTDLRNGLGSDIEGHKILDQIMSVQKEIIDLEKELESTTTPQVGTLPPPPPYNYAIQIAVSENNYNALEVSENIYNAL